jgi:hypothetical protein
MVIVPFTPDPDSEALRKRQNLFPYPYTIYLIPPNTLLRPRIILMTA